jgi:23S rRNA (adenine2503-C2)-methyltransferase
MQSPLPVHKPLIYDLDRPALVKLMGEWGEPPYRAGQIWAGLYRQLWNSSEQFTNLPAALRSQLNATFTFANLKSAAAAESSDGDTRKTVFELPDGRLIETVRMQYEADSGRSRRTLCISSQAGCAMGCVFCATGQMGFKRNLSSGEILEQVLYYARILRQGDGPVTNVVVMGMGEPFHNYDETLKAIDRLNNSDGFNFGARRFTISTVGLVPGIRRFTEERRQVNLAISLHAAENELRSSLLPINKKYPLETLIPACLDYVNSTGRRITFEWALIQDVNDTPEQARRLVDLIKSFRRGSSALCHVNVIPLNPTQKYSGQATTRQRAEMFRQILEAAGFPCTVRVRRGIDIAAGCGQLAGVQTSGEKS